MNVFFMLLTAASAGGQCSGCAVPAAIPHAAPIVSSGCDCACGAVSSVAAPAEERQGFLARCFKRKKKQEPAPAADCGCDPCAAPISTCGDCGACAEAAAPAEERRGFFHRFKRKKKEEAPAADCGCDPCCGGAPTVIGGHYHGNVIAPAPIHGAPIHGHGAPVITTPGHGAPVITTPGSGEPLKAMPKPDDKPKTDGKPATKGGEKGARLDSGSSIAPAGAKVETDSRSPF